MKKSRTFQSFGIIPALFLQAQVMTAQASEEMPFMSLPQATTALKAFKALTQIPEISSLVQSADAKLNAVQNVEGAGIQTTKFQSYFKGLEVIGSMALHHQGVDGEQISNLIKKFDLNVRPTVSADEAFGIAQSFLEERELDQEPVLKILPINGTDAAHLVYWVSLKPTETEAGHDLVINAHTGGLIADISHHQEIAPIQVYATNNKCQVLDPISGAPLALNYKNCTQTVTNSKASVKADSSARRALSNSVAVLNYYQKTHGRNSYDGKGSHLVSVVHVGDKFANAFWNSDDNTMSYGDGDGVEMADLTLSLDVAGHEMTHGITSKTAQLIYMDESGALNEAFSDYFGVMIAGKNEWAIGKEVFLGDKKQTGLRDLKNPASIQVKYRDDAGNVVEKAYPAHVKDRFKTVGACGSQNDRCFVHLNSTIPSHAAYLIHQGLGKAKAEKLLFVTLTQFLVATADFANFRDATVKACAQLYDKTSCLKVDKAFKQVGL